MKKILIMLMGTLVFFAGAAFAEELPETGEPAVLQTAENISETISELDVSNEVSVNIQIGENGNIYPKNLVLGIYSSSGQFWGANHVWVAEENCNKSMSFSVPEYTKGEKLFISVFSGADSIEYAGGKYKPGDMIEIDTASDISIKVIPLQAVYVKAFANEWELYFKNPAKLIDGVTMIPLDELPTAAFTN